MLARRISQFGRWPARVTLLVMLAATCLTGCADFFNPSFVNLFAADGDGDGAFAAVDSPAGHVPILFRNSARMSDAVFRYVIQGETVVRPEVIEEIRTYNPQLSREDIGEIIQSIINDEPVDLEDINLPPRARVTLDVINDNGGVQTLEFLNGLRLVRTETAAEQLPQDLTENTNNAFIAQCDVAVLTAPTIDVFIPTDLQFTRNIFDRDGFIIGEECFTFVPPQFDSLEPDEAFDASQGEFSLQRNYDPRFFPPDLTSLQCGAVVIVELTGELFLPFRDVPSECDPPNPPANGLVPALLNTDGISAAQLPGRYGLTMSVRTSN